MTPEDIIRTLGMQPHPEGGHFVETWRDAPADGSRGAGDGDLLPAAGRRGVGLASGRRGGDLALVRRRPAGPDDLRGRTRCPGCASGGGPRAGTATPGGGAERGVAERRNPSDDGRWSAARSARPSTSPGSSSHRRTGGRPRGSLARGHADGDAAGPPGRLGARSAGSRRRSVDGGAGRRWGSCGRCCRSAASPPPMPW